MAAEERTALGERATCNGRRLRRRSDASDAGSASFLQIEEMGLGIPILFCELEVVCLVEFRGRNVFDTIVSHLVILFSGEVYEIIHENPSY